MCEYVLPPAASSVLKSQAFPQLGSPVGDQLAASAPPKFEFGQSAS